MPYNPEIHHRRSIRLQGYDYSQARAYFLTICTHGRECLFGEIRDEKMYLNDIGRIVAHEWLKSPVIRAEIELDEWVVMPNHMHGIAVITDAGAKQRNVTKKRKAVDQYWTDNQPVGQFTGRFIGQPSGRPPIVPTGPKKKSVGAMMAGFKSSVTGRVNAYRQSPGSEVWQRNYWDHVIRNATELDTLRKYIQTNPARWQEDSLYATG